MISMDELLKGAKLADQTPEIQANLQTLLDRINKVRTAWGKPMTVTSGLRTWEDHTRIYKQKAQKEGKTFDESKVPKKSRHLFGMAVDIADPDKSLATWIQANLQLMEEIGFWFEDFNVTVNWCHFQTTPPLSGNRVFKP